ncbi:MAG: SPOR domain-containing protein [Sphingomonas bacterium]|nr:SPOR domain-containing protein [Sphingomonas bacterium]
MKLTTMRGVALAAAMILASPAHAFGVRSGIEAWQKGDHSAAVAVWRPLAIKGDADAAFNLGQAYRLGKGVPIDLAEAQRLFEQAARKGHLDAATTLGILLFQNGNQIAALRWLKKAAEAGEPRAMLLYGTALYNGDGVEADAVTAYAFVSRAAAQGLAPARATLADLDDAMPLEQRQKGVALAKTMAATPTFAAPVATKAALPPKSAPAAKALTPVAASGDWRIQLGAFGQRGAAEALFARLSGRLAGRQPYYVPAGKVVRLQVGPFGSRAAATAACARLGGQACFAVAAR